MTDFDSYVKANDAVMRNVQNQGQNLQAQLNNLATLNQRLERCIVVITEVTKDTMLPTNNGSTEDVQPPVIQVQSQNPTSEPVVDPILSFELALRMPWTLLSDILPRPLKNLTPGNKERNLSLPELTPTCMTLELADRSITEPIGIAKDVRLMVGKFQFPADFVVVDFEPDPRGVTILILEALLNSEPLPPLRIIKIIHPESGKNLKLLKLIIIFDEPFKVELKDCTSFRNTHFWTADDKLPVILRKIKDEAIRPSYQGSKVHKRASLGDLSEYQGC
ncbi:hypothetical protein Tco_0418164 [Tanacetum coccineum]